MSDTILRELNKQQAEAVTSLEGPLLILAGAGSGKTRVITHRIAYIIAKKFAKGEEILAVTFTNKAANEMRERVYELLKEIGAPLRSIPYLGTFHSICVKILKIDGHHGGIANSFVIYDTADQLDTIKQAMKNLFIDIKQFNPRTVRAYISDAKNKMIDHDDYKSSANGYFQERVAEIYPEYQKLLKEQNALDFDDLINETVDLLKNFKEVRYKYQKRFKYILIDEYQDTNNAQYELIQLLVNPETNNLCVVGDEDQSIYKFRGATIENILNFEKDFSDSKLIKLEQNYRSTDIILSAAFEVIKHNTERKEKRLWTKEKSEDKIKVYKADDQEDEGYYICEMIMKAEKDDEIAVLYRTNAQSRALEEVMMRHRIPYKLVGGVKFYERKEVKDLIAYVKSIYNNKDNTSLKRIINVPPRKIGAKTIDTLERNAKKEELSIFEYLLTNKDRLNGALSHFVKLIEDLTNASKEMNIYDFLLFILKRTGYIDWLNDGSEENIARAENLKELLTVAYTFKGEDPEASISAFLSDISLSEQERSQEWEENQEQVNANVTLLTIHAAKGLEFDHVFITGMEESLFPHSRSYLDPSEMEEERRLAYVAITRAKKFLYLTHAEKRMIWGRTVENPVSRFLTDIPGNLVEEESIFTTLMNKEPEIKKEKVSFDFSNGDKVVHPIFKDGVIVSIDKEIVVVSFEHPVGIKKLALEYANLAKKS